MKNHTEQLFPHAILYGVRISKITTPILQEGISLKRRHQVLLQAAEKEGPHTVVVSAPAGYGKSTLVAAWLSGISAATVWLTLDKYDCEPQRFFKGIVAAFVRQFPVIEANLASLIDLPIQLGIENAAEMIAYEIEQNNERFYLVLDDVHAIDNPEVLLFIQHLLNILPENLCLVLISRSDPRLKIARLRMDNILTEIRIDDLRLTRDEIGEFLKTGIGMQLKADALAMIERRTEGWLAGIKLLAVTMQETNPEDLEDFLNNFTSSHKYIIEYLAEEILSHLPAELVGFMHASSLFDFFSPEVCNEVFGFKESAVLIEKLEDLNLLIHPIDNSFRWYHYHPLLKNYLRSVSATVSQDTYIAGARWFERHGFMQEALRLAVKSGNEELYFTALTAEAEKLFKTGEYRSLSRWLDHLPDSFFEEHTHFNVYRAWTLFFQGNKTEAADFADSLLNSGTMVYTDSSRARLECLIILAADGQGNSYDTEVLTGMAEKIKIDDLFIWIIIQLICGNSAFRVQQFSEAEKYYNAAMEMSVQISNTYLTICSVFNLSFVLIQTGKWTQAKQLCTQELKKREISKKRHQPIAEILYVPLSRVLRKSESAEYDLDLGSRGEYACRNFFFMELISLHCSSISEEKHKDSLLEPLSKRELDVLRLIAKGYSNADIAATLFVSLGTVKWHINNIFGKLDSKNRTQAVLKAEEYKII